MTTSPFQDCVAIDTNVFEHLLNPEMNAQSHINQLLVYLQEQGVMLIVDSGDRISNEYNHRIGPILSRSSNTGIEMDILRYWIRYAKPYKVKLNMGDDLMRAIKGVIREHSESVDRIFVYVALTMGKPLISNDERHIVFGPEGDRWNRLLRDTRRMRTDGADILTSREARGRIPDKPA